jgi:hypothetical protein
MTAADVPGQATPDVRGDVRFVDTSTRMRLRSAVEEAGWLLVALPPLGPAARSQLGLRVEEAIEEALQRRGAAAPGGTSRSDPRTMLADQLYRGQLVGVKGIAVTFESLSGLAGPSGALGDEDSETLRLLSDAARESALAVWLTPTDMVLPAYRAPVPLKLLLDGRDRPERAEKEGPEDAARTRCAMPRPAEDDKTSAMRLDGSLVPWRGCARALDEAEGPKPLVVVERLFVESYLPLQAAVVRGEADPKSTASAERFSTAFEKSYREAFTALKVTRKRPLMVLDAPQVASRVARLHGARGATLLAVDALRYDLGLRVEQRLQQALHGAGVLAERVLFWSALPSVTPVQLRLLARGPQGLSEPPDKNDLQEDQMVMPGGRASGLVRRIRVGGRELHKLDVVRADLAGNGPSEPERLEALAEAVALPVARFAMALAPRTLLFLFGDHGFVLPRNEVGTGPAEQGGARPEEVLVPGQAWLIGGVH